MIENMKNLDFQIIEEASKQYENISEIVVFIETEEKIQSFKVEIYKKFSPVKIKMCLQELIEKMDMVKVYDKNRMEAVFIPYMIFLTIKHFTTLKLPNIFEQQLKAIENMTNTGVMFQIFSSFEEDELNKIKDEASFITEHFEKNMPEMKKIREEVKEKLVDKSLLE